MRLLFFISFLLAALPAWSQGCFKAFQNGQEVTVICAGIPVFFEDCAPNPDSRDIIFYDPGPAAFNPSSYDESKLVRKGSDDRYQYTYTQPGTYIVTQIINRQGGGGTTTHPRTFEVKASPQPAFTVTGCANRSVQVNITDENYDLFDINYGDGTTRNNVEAGEQAAHTYTGTGPYTLRLTGKYTGAACSSPEAQQAVTLLPPVNVPVIARLEVIREETAGELSISLQNLQSGYSYAVERLSPATGAYETVATTPIVSLNNLNNFLIQGINTAEATRYRVRPVDRCGSAIRAVSVPVSSIALRVQPGDEQATLNWTGNNTNVQRYEIFRNGALVQSVGRDVKTYTESNLTCGQNYCYRVTATESGGVTTSLSAQRCVNVVSSRPPPAGYLYTTYDESNHVVLSLSIPPGQEAQQVQYRRSIDGTPYSPFATSGQPSLTDQLKAPASVCYRATYTNRCDIQSGLSNISCPVYLLVQFSENDPIVRLGWTGYVGFPDGVGQYTVEVLDVNNQVTASYPAAGNTYIDRNLSGEVQELRYRIKVTSANGSVSYSNTETVRQPLQVHIPSAFTPNNDGLNDVLEIKGRFIRDFQLKVYNSLGNVVFQSSDRSDNWDGTYQGKLQPAGVYAYEISITTTSGEHKRRTGTVTLLR